MENSKENQIQDKISTFDNFMERKNSTLIKLVRNESDKKELEKSMNLFSNS